MPRRVCEVSNICKTCSETISWDQKKRESLHIRGPINTDGHISIDGESVQKTLENLTNSVNALVFALCSETELQRVQD